MTFAMRVFIVHDGAASIGGLFQFRASVQCRILAPTGPAGLVWRCPLFEADRKWCLEAMRAVVDPKATLRSIGAGIA